MSSGEPVDPEFITIRNNLFSYILSGCHSKQALKESDLLAVCNKKKATYIKALPEVKEGLKNIYGIILSEVNDGKTPKRFFCYSEFPAAAPLLEFDAKQKKELTFLFLILSFLLLTDESAYEDEIKAYLETQKINVNESHPYFGSDLKHLMSDTFVRQLYLKKEKSDSELDTETKYIYSWGPRALVEFPKKNLLQTLENILKMPMKIFYKKYASLDEEEMSAEGNEDE